MKTTMKICVLVSIIMLCVPGMAFISGVEAEEAAEDSLPARMAFVFVRPENDPITQWLILIYTEAFRRMGIEFVFQEVPTKRASSYSDRGYVDGELGRISDYSRTHPNLIRVEEHNYIVNFSAFTSDPKIILNGWASLQGSDYMVEYRRGVTLCEARLPDVVPPDRLSDITTVHQGIGKLMIGRTDVFVDVETIVIEYLKSDEFRQIGGKRTVYKAGVMEQASAHAFLHKKHRALVPKLSGILRKMKEEGLFKTYRYRVGITSDGMIW